MADASYRVLTIPTNAALTNYRLPAVARRIIVQSMSAPFSIRLESENSDSIPVNRPGKIVACDRMFNNIYLSIATADVVADGQIVLALLTDMDITSEAESSNDGDVLVNLVAGSDALYKVGESGSSVSAAGSVATVGSASTLFGVDSEQGAPFAGSGLNGEYEGMHSIAPANVTADARVSSNHYKGIVMPMTALLTTKAAYPGSYEEWELSTHIRIAETGAGAMAANWGYGSVRYLAGAGDCSLGGWGMFIEYVKATSPNLRGVVYRHGTVAGTVFRVLDLNLGVPAVGINKVGIALARTPSGPRLRFKVDDQVKGERQGGVVADLNVSATAISVYGMNQGVWRSLGNANDCIMISSGIMGGYWLTHKWL